MSVLVHDRISCNMIELSALIVSLHLGGSLALSCCLHLTMAFLNILECVFLAAAPRPRPLPPVRPYSMYDRFPAPDMAESRPCIQNRATGVFQSDMTARWPYKCDRCNDVYLEPLHTHRSRGGDRPSCTHGDCIAMHAMALARNCHDEEVARCVGYAERNGKRTERGWASKCVRKREREQ